MRTEIERKILVAPSNTLIDLSEFDIPCKNVKFITDDEKGFTEYSWETDSTHGILSSFPMKDSNYVKFWKTLGGAKRNFLKHISMWIK